MRNHVLVLGINGLVMRAAERISLLTAGTVCVATPSGRGHIGEDHDVQLRHFVGLGRNPNIAAVLVVGADKAAADAVAHHIAAEGKPVSVVSCDEAGEDALRVVDLGMRRAARLVREASAERRGECGLSELVVAVECGHSDATSGIACNPVVGAAVDMLVDGGATVLMGETVEWLGAEHLLAARARTGDVAERIVHAVRRREDKAARAGVNLTGRNPGEENIRGGLSTIEEKSLGAIIKSGSRPIEDILAVAEAAPGRGLYLMDGPSFSPESMTGFTAAGAQLILFTTGLGNGGASLIAPTIKLSARVETVGLLTEQIDFDARAAWTGEETVEEVAARLVQSAMHVAEGCVTWGEIFREGMEVATRVGGSL